MKLLDRPGVFDYLVQMAKHGPVGSGADGGRTGRPPDGILPPHGRAEGLPEHLLLLMMASSRMMMLEAARAAPNLRLTPPQFRILNFVFRNPGVSLSQVAAQLGVRLPTASVMLVKLAKEQLVTRERDPASRRRMQLLLTPRGEQVIAVVRSNVFARVEARLSQLEDPARADLERAMPSLELLFRD